MSGRGMEMLRKAAEKAKWELSEAQSIGGVSPNQHSWMRDVQYANGKPDEVGPAHAYIWWPDHGPASGCVDFERGGGHILGIDETKDLLVREFVAYRSCCASMGDPFDCNCDTADAYLTEKGRAILEERLPAPTSEGAPE